VAGSGLGDLPEFMLNVMYSDEVNIKIIQLNFCFLFFRPLRFRHMETHDFCPWTIYCPGIFLVHFSLMTCFISYFWWFR